MVSFIEISKIGVLDDIIDIVNQELSLVVGAKRESIQLSSELMIYNLAAISSKVLELDNKKSTFLKERRVFGVPGVNKLVTVEMSKDEATVGSTFEASGGKAKVEFNP